MAKRVKVQQVDVSAAVERVMDSNISTTLEMLDVGYAAVVTELVQNNKVEGTILYVPGATYKTLTTK